jgi:inner membrane protein involved in colicin E2 resistance
MEAIYLFFFIFLSSILLLFLVPLLLLLDVLADSCGFRNQTAMNDCLHVPAALVNTAAIG